MPPRAIVIAILRAASASPGCCFGSSARATSSTCGSRIGAWSRSPNGCKARGLYSALVVAYSLQAGILIGSTRVLVFSILKGRNKNALTRNLVGRNRTTSDLDELHWKTGEPKMKRLFGIIAVAGILALPLISAANAQEACRFECGSYSHMDNW